MEETNFINACVGYCGSAELCRPDLLLQHLSRFSVLSALQFYYHQRPVSCFNSGVVCAIRR